MNKKGSVAFSLNERGFAAIIIIIVLLLLVAAIGGVFIFGDKTPRDKSEREYSSTDIFSPGNRGYDATTPEIPNNLSLPFKIENISLNSGILNPLGIIRNDRDSGLGHGGLDFPLTPGSQVYAVADGEVIEISTVSNLPGDEKLVTLLESTSRGEGWIFIYEHILINDEMKTGDKVKRGDLLGTHILKERTSHYQLSYAFNNLEYYKSSQCWPEFLVSDDQKLLNSFWETYKKSSYALEAWKSITEDGNYAYLALLDKNKYPDGVRLCYPTDTDARIPAN